MAILKTNVSQALSHEGPFQSIERLLSCSFKYLGCTAPSSAKVADIRLTVDHLISMPGAQDVLEGLSDNR